MGYLDSLNIAGPALATERSRTDIIMQDLANQNTIKMTEGSPYTKKQVALRENALDLKNELGRTMTKAENGGVYIEEVVGSQNLLASVYDPNHPNADEGECMMMPNVNSAKEMVDLMAAARAYEANVTALNIAKSMALKALEVGK